MSENIPQKIKLTYDARMLGYSGIGTQVFNALQLLIPNPTIELTLLGHPERIKSQFPNFTGVIRPWRAAIYSIQEQLTYLKPAPGHLLHVPHYNAPLRFLSCTVVVLHDLIHLQSEEFARPDKRLYVRALLAFIARRALRIVTVSETTRQEFLQRFPAASSKTDVIHNGLDHELFRPQSEERVAQFRKKYGLPAYFLLAVGIGKKHKNVDFVIRSLAPHWKSGTLQTPLLIAGSGGEFPAYVATAIQAGGVADFVKATPFFDADELPALYAAADMLVMPSLLEGFGFPIIEAMACGTPVIAARASCLPEIAGTAALFFDPYNTEEFAVIAMEALGNEKRRAELTAKGLQQAKRYSWRRHADEFVRLYRELAPVLRFRRED